jgi:hypothetical protein
MLPCDCPCEHNPFYGRLCYEHLNELLSMKYHFKVALILMYWKEYLRKRWPRP